MGVNIIEALNDLPIKITDLPVKTEEVASIKSPLEWYLSRKLTITNLSSNIPIIPSGDDYIINPVFTVTLDSVANATADAKGNKWLEIWEGNLIYQGEIISVSVNDVTLATPIQFPFTTNATVYIVDINQNRDFTDATGIGQQQYSLSLGDSFNSNLLINRFIVTMLHAGESDSSLYGDIEALPKGIYFCGKGTRFPEETGLDGNLELGNCLFNIKTNSDYESTAYDVQFRPKSGNPAAGTLYGTIIRKTFSGLDKSGIAIPVQSERAEATRAVFRDNLNSLSQHRIRVMGRFK